MILRCLALCLIIFFVSCNNKNEKNPVQKPLSINEIQLIGTHNSYKKAIPEPLLKRIKDENPSMAESLDYSHPNFWEQLNAGLRLFELDIYYDPEGGRFSNPLGKGMVDSLQWDKGFDAPGFKVFHVQDIDFLSHHALFRDYLADLKTWSSFHPNHLPIFISINAKDENYPDLGFTQTLQFDQVAFGQLDKEIESFLGLEKLITPKNIQGEYKDLKTAVLESGWPNLDEARGKFIFILDEGEQKVASYLAKGDGLIFVKVPEEHSMSAIHIINDPIKNYDQISEYVKRGYIVRTRADAGTKEARSNDTKRREMAFSSGAQLVSTDYYKADPRWEGGYKVHFEEEAYARINPLVSKNNASLQNLSEESTEAINIDPQTFLLAEKELDAVILDVRTKEEVAQGLIPGAVNMDFLQEGFADKIASLDKNQKVLVYCKVGGRSKKAADLLIKKGFSQVFNLEGGYDHWKKNGYPVKK
ncbi:Ca2+-dependent phosphoinositide-specific phospholipase C [Cyclobacterium sediminis]